MLYLPDGIANMDQRTRNRALFPELTAIVDQLWAEHGKEHTTIRYIATEEGCIGKRPDDFLITPEAVESVDRWYKARGIG